jgi:hypothetical protein
LSPTPNIAIALVGLAALLALLLAYLYRQKRLGYLRLWAWAWLLVAAHYLTPALSRWVPQARWETALNSLVLALAVLLLLISAQAYSQARVRMRLAIGVAAPVGSAASPCPRISVRDSC